MIYVMTSTYIYIYILCRGFKFNVREKNIIELF